MSRRRDTVQNILITVLAVSAALLFSRTQFFQLGAAAVGSSWLRLTAPVDTTDSGSALSGVLSAPVRIAVTGEYGRYGSVSLTTDSDTFLPLKALLREVLGSARSRTETDAEAFQAALRTSSVYCDFLSPLPVAYLADLMEGTVESSLDARALAVAEEDDRVVLLLWDGSDGYHRCATAVQAASLTQVVDEFQLGVSAFAFEDEDYGAALAPLSLFPDPLPELPQLTVDTTPADTDRLLAALGFNPHTNSRYQEAGGAEVIVEGDRSVRISSGGTVSYSNGGEAGITVDAAGMIPTAEEAVAGVQDLLESLLPDGDARLFLLRIEQNDKDTLLTFGYHLTGVPIRFSDGGAAAEVVLTETSVTSLTLRSRQYTAAGTVSSLLPLAQAKAIIAAGEEGAELSIGYADNGSDTLSAVWLAD